MEKGEIVQKTADHIKQLFAGEGSGHDWWHVYRVWKTAVFIGKKEKADLFVVQLAALLHDIADWKFHGGDESVGPKKASEWLESIGVEDEMVSRVSDMVKKVSFKGGKGIFNMTDLEGRVVQDADRLDAMGAIGIARVFAYGGSRGRVIHSPGLEPKMKPEPFEQHCDHRSTSINHFYEKLLLLKDYMNTKTAKKLAERRHKVMQDFLDEFYGEWDFQG